MTLDELIAEARDVAVVDRYESGGACAGTIEALCDRLEAARGTIAHLADAARQDRHGDDPEARLIGEGATAALLSVTVALSTGSGKVTHYRLTEKGKQSLTVRADMRGAKYK